ncbi:MAG TPA: hypothetical protein VF532_22425 [Candidatus Angelobacter sp.]
MHTFSRFICALSLAGMVVSAKGQTSRGCNGTPKFAVRTLALEPSEQGVKVRLEIRLQSHTFCPSDSGDRLALVSGQVVTEKGDPVTDFQFAVPIAARKNQPVAIKSSLQEITLARGKYLLAIHVKDLKAHAPGGRSSRDVISLDISHGRDGTEAKKTIQQGLPDAGKRPASNQAVPPPRISATDTARLLADGEQQFRHGYCDSAVPIFRQALEGGVAPRAHLRIAQCLMTGKLESKKEAELAADLLRKEITLNPGEAGLHLDLALAFDLQDLSKEAEEEYEAAARLSPGNAALLTAFSAHFLSRDPSRALQQARQAVALAPNDAEAHHALATALAAQSRQRDYGKEALAEAQKAVQLSPEQWVYRDALASVLANTKDGHGAAINAAQDALAIIRPGEPQARANVLLTLAGVYASTKGGRDDAIRALRESLALREGSAFFYSTFASLLEQRADATHSQADYAEAAAAYRKARQLSDGSAEDEVRLSRVLQKMNSIQAGPSNRPRADKAEEHRRQQPEKSASAQMALHEGEWTPWVAASFHGKKKAGDSAYRFRSRCLNGHPQVQFQLNASQSSLEHVQLSLGEQKQSFSMGPGSVAELVSSTANCSKLPKAVARLARDENGYYTEIVYKDGDARWDMKGGQSLLATFVEALAAANGQMPAGTGGSSPRSDPPPQDSTPSQGGYYPPEPSPLPDSGTTSRETSPSTPQAVNDANSCIRITPSRQMASFSNGCSRPVTASYCVKWFNPKDTRPGCSHAWSCGQDGGSVRLSAGGSYTVGSGMANHGHCNDNCVDEIRVNAIFTDLPSEKKARLEEPKVPTQCQGWVK